jgi:hypothetical protein
VIRAIEVVEDTSTTAAGALLLGNVVVVKVQGSDLNATLSNSRPCVSRIV